jgi:hypothetical protein
MVIELDPWSICGIHSELALSCHRSVVSGANRRRSPAMCFGSLRLEIAELGVETGSLYATIAADQHSLI